MSYGSKAGLAGKQNCELLQLAEKAGFELLLTVDKGLPYQQNLACRNIALLVFMLVSNTKLVCEWQIKQHAAN
jgi:hypothetical protein